ncbi:hypothetical protein ACX3O0_01510 [Homoserinimonas sp. A447]
MLILSLWQGIVRAGAWPAEQIAACSSDIGCALSAILTEGAPVWLGFLWLVAIVTVLVFGVRLPQVPGTPKSVARKLAAQRTREGQRIGRAVGWVLVASLFGFILVLALVPIGAGVVASATWSKERRDACSADPMCVISTIPGNALPAWIALIWIAIIAAALVICWKPSRWWLPDAEARRHVKVRTYTSPDWIVRHSLVAALISVGCLFGIFKRGNDVYSLDYIWAILAALTVGAAASVCKRKYGMRTPLDVKLSLMLTASALSGVGDRRWGALQRQLHPRPAKKNTKRDADDA